MLKIEKKIKDDFEKRQLSANHLWPLLADRLDQKMYQEKKPRRRQWSYAVSILFVIGLTIGLVDQQMFLNSEIIIPKWTIKNSGNPVLNARTTPAVNLRGTDRNSKKDATTGTAVDTHENDAIKRNTHTAVATNFNPLPLQLFQSKKLNSSAQIGQLKAVLNEIETKLLLDQALYQVAHQQNLKALQLEKTAKGLLVSVEEQLEREETIKSRVLSILKTGFSNLEYVINRKK